MINKETIRKIVEEKIAGTDIFIVDITIGKGSIIFIKLDKLANISLEECIAVNRFVEEKLDRDKEDFSLEVSSPGIGEPLKVIQQFHKCINKQVQAITKDGDKKTGTLLSISGNEITIEAEEKVKDEKSKKKILLKNKYQFPIESITVKEVISFK